MQTRCVCAIFMSMRSLAAGYLRLQILDRKLSGSQPLSDKSKWVFLSLRHIDLCHAKEAYVVIPNHEEERSAQVMGLQLQFGVEPLHECMKIAAFFL